MCPCIQRCTLSVSVFTRQIRSSDCSLSLFANRIVTLSHSSANIEQPPPLDLFKDFNNITGGRMYSMFLCLPTSCLPNTNTIASVAAEKTRVPHSAGEIIFFGGGQTRSVAPKGFLCVCWCRVVGVCSSPRVIHCYDSLFYELFSHYLSSSTQTETIQWQRGIHIHS